MSHMIKRHQKSSQDEVGFNLLYFDVDVLGLAKIVSFSIVTFIC